MKQYLEQVQQIIDQGCERGDRTGTGTLSLFGMQTRYDLRDGFPLCTTKRVNLPAIVKELLWFLRGETNIKTLDCKIWDEWANTYGELGPIYGAQWTSWPVTYATEPTMWGSDKVVVGDTVNQIQELVENLKTNPESRRHIVSAWNVADIPNMALPPCHTMFQCYASKIPREGSGDRMRYAKDVLNIEDPEVYKRSARLREAGVPDYFLDLQLYQRSGDMMLGVKCAPFRSDTI